MNKRKVAYLVLALVVIVSTSVIIFGGSRRGNNEIIVGEAVEENGLVKSPFDELYKENFKRVVKNNSYIKNNYTLEEHHTEFMSALGEGYFSLNRSFTVIGSGENYKSFNASIETHNDFSEPNAISIAFDVKDNAKEVNEAIHEIITELFNKKIADAVILEGKQGEFESGSGEYKLEISKTETESINDAITLQYKVRFLRGESERIHISKYTKNEKLPHIFNEFYVLSGSINDDNFGDKLGALYAEGTNSEVLEIFNSKSYKGGSEIRDSSITIKNHINPTISTVTMLGVLNNKSLILLETSTKYEVSEVKALESALRIINGLFNTELNMDSLTIEGNVYSTTVEISKFNRVYNLEVNFNVHSNENGFYVEITALGD